MLMEKAGTAFFYVIDPETANRGEVNNCDFNAQSRKNDGNTAGFDFAICTHHKRRG